eukprot:comp21515_c0_seq1/m.46995 comp21515_c0_seq1/g.46995  ORF comp21515_c0_seq1/g.46995 comp21515_c0_seq1/m.46995 type:complete len:121 (-) comp21515_c0_seq1:43-405(-)
MCSNHRCTTGTTSSRNTPHVNTRTIISPAQSSSRSPSLSKCSPSSRSPTCTPSTSAPSFDMCFDGGDDELSVDFDLDFELELEAETGVAVGFDDPVPDVPCPGLDITVVSSSACETTPCT